MVLLLRLLEWMMVLALPVRLLELMMVQLGLGTVQRAPQYCIQRAEGFASKLWRLCTGLPIRPVLGRLN